MSTELLSLTCQFTATQPRASRTRQLYASCKHQKGRDPPPGCTEKPSGSRRSRVDKVDTATFPGLPTSEQPAKSLRPENYVSCKQQKGRDPSSLGHRGEPSGSRQSIIDKVTFPSLPTCQLPNSQRRASRTREQVSSCKQQKGGGDPSSPGRREEPSGSRRCRSLQSPGGKEVWPVLLAAT